MPEVHASRPRRAMLSKDAPQKRETRTNSAISLRIHLSENGVQQRTARRDRPVHPGFLSPARKPSRRTNSFERKLIGFVRPETNRLDGKQSARQDALVTVRNRCQHAAAEPTHIHPGCSYRSCAEDCAGSPAYSKTVSSNAVRIRLVRPARAGVGCRVSGPRRGNLANGGPTAPAEMRDTQLVA